VLKEVEMSNELYLEYAKAIEMCKGTRLEECPWQCVKVTGGVRLEEHPFFMNSSHLYEFAVAVLEDKPVFIGDTLYSKIDGEECPVHVHGGRIKLLTDVLTWSKKKRTFEINGIELPCPVDEGARCTGGRLVFLGLDYFFQTIKDKNLVAMTINEILIAAKKEK